MIYVFTPAGEIAGSHRVPADMPMGCSFGDPGLASLYVTTAAGELFRVRASGLQGCAVPDVLR